MVNSILSLKKPLLLWGIATLFFAFQFILRLSVGILREEIIQKFAIDTIAFGTLAGYYYLGYAGMQIPIGIMLDRFSFRIVTSVSVATSSIGTLLFVTAQDWHYLLLGRFMIGAGSAVGFLAIAKITKSYFSPKYHSFMLGLSFTFGLVGAVFGVTPMKLLFSHFGYYNTFTALAIIGFAISILMLSISTKGAQEYDSGAQSSCSAIDIIKLLFNPTILIIGLSGGLMVGTLEGYADVWAIPFFKQIYNMSDTESNITTSFLYIGMCFGGPALALLTEITKSPNLIIFLSGLFTIIIFLILFYTSSLSVFSCTIMMFMLGIFCCYQVLVFTVASNLVEKSFAGLAIAIINCINMSFGHFFHKIMSIVIQLDWDGAVNSCNLPIYTKEDFIASIAIVPICCLLGILGFAYVAQKMHGPIKCHT